MMPPIILPHMTAIVGQPLEMEIGLEDPTATTPAVSLSGYTVAGVIGVAPFDTATVTATGSITAEGRVLLSFTAAQISTLAPALAVGGRVSHWLQITVTSPAAGLAFVLQGPLTIAGVFSA